MQTAFRSTVLRLTPAAVMMMAVVLAPVGATPHHDPAALAGAQALVETLSEETCAEAVKRRRRSQ